MSRSLERHKEPEQHLDLAPDEDHLEAEHDPAVSRRASLADLRRHSQVQRKAAGDASTDAVHDAAAQGVASPETQLPHLDAIQGAFGAHDVSNIRAHVGGDSAQAMGAEAYATGNHVVFDKQPDLHTAAHEAAHVVQQAQGVNLYGGVGKAGDHYEQQADAVADRVVQGKSAEDLLGPASNAAVAAPTGAVQHKGKPKTQDELKDASDVGNMIAVASSLTLLAKHIQQGTRDLRQLVDGPHKTDAGDQPALEQIGEIHDSLIAEAMHVSGLIGTAEMDKVMKKEGLRDQVKQCMGALTWYFPAIQHANAFRAKHKEQEWAFLNPYHLSQVVMGLPEKIGFEKNDLVGTEHEPEGSVSSLESAAAGAHIAATLAAIEAAPEGSWVHSHRVMVHLKELVYLARNDPGSMKKHKSQIRKLLKALQPFERSRPGMKDELEGQVRQLKSLI